MDLIGQSRFNQDWVLQNRLGWTQNDPWWYRSRGLDRYQAEYGSRFVCCPYLIQPKLNLTQPIPPNRLNHVRLSTILLHPILIILHDLMWHAGPWFWTNKSLTYQFIMLYPIWKETFDLLHLYVNRYLHVYLYIHIYEHGLSQHPFDRIEASTLPI